jgi:hypothetical protein
MEYYVDMIHQNKRAKKGYLFESAFINLGSTPKKLVDYDDFGGI